MKRCTAQLPEELEEKFIKKAELELGTIGYSSSNRALITLFVNNKLTKQENANV